MTKPCTLLNFILYVLLETIHIIWLKLTRWAQKTYKTDQAADQVYVQQVLADCKKAKQVGNMKAVRIEVQVAMHSKLKYRQRTRQVKRTKQPLQIVGEHSTQQITIDYISGYIAMHMQKTKYKLEDWPGKEDWLQQTTDNLFREIVIADSRQL